MKKRYMTTNLDEAAFLALHGLKCRHRCIDDLSARFFFEHTRTMEQLRKQFWVGGIKVNLHSWLSMRQNIKNELKGQLKLDTKARDVVRAKKDASLSHSVVNPNPYYPALGQQYYTPTAKGVAVMNWYGEKPVHRLRSDAHKCFKTKEEAIAASMAI